MPRTRTARNCRVKAARPPGVRPFRAASARFSRLAGYFIWLCIAISQDYGTTDTEGPRCKKLLEAGAVRLKFKADAAFEEEEHYAWIILRACNWNAEAVLGWRFTKAELSKRQERNAPAKKQPQVGRATAFPA